MEGSDTDSGGHCPGRGGQGELSECGESGGGGVGGRQGARDVEEAQGSPERGGSGKQ